MYNIHYLLFIIYYIHYFTLYKNQSNNYDDYIFMKLTTYLIICNLHN